MKANEAPEKIYLFESPVSGTLVLEWMPKRLTKNDIEYTRTDAIIKKAAEWLRKNADNYTWYDETEGESGMVDGFIEVFRNYMKGE